MTLIQTAKLNGVDPMAWLTDVLERIVSGRTKANELHTLLAVELGRIADPDHHLTGSVADAADQRRGLSITRCTADTARRRQSLPNPRGGAIAWSSARSNSQIACNASAVALSCRLLGKASSHAAY